MMTTRDRIDAELQRFLHVEALDRKCYVTDLSATITNAALNLALEAYRMGMDDEHLYGPHKPRSARPTMLVPAQQPNEQSKRPTKPPPGGKRKRSTAPPSRPSR